MARGELSPTSIVKMSRAQQQAGRARALDLARDLLKAAPMTTHQLFEALGTTRSTGFSYLRKLASDGEAHMTDQRHNGMALWTAGPDPKMDATDDAVDAAMELKRYVAQASQVGMWRDPLVAALFGPAT
jgi:hypothetical protein